MNIRSRGSLVAVATALLVSLVVGIAPATPATAASIGTLELRDSLGRALPGVVASQLPSFATAVATGTCPVGFQDATRLAIVAGGSTFVATANQSIADVAAPASATFDTPVSDYSTAATMTVRLECLHLQNGIGVASGSYFESTLTATGAGSYSVAPAPVIAVAPTATSLAVSPASPAALGATVVLRATVGGATVASATGVGSVEFFDGTATLGSAKTAAGVATFSSASFGAGQHAFRAVFTPDEPLYYAPSTSSSVAFAVVGRTSTAAPSPSPDSTPAPSVTGAHRDRAGNLAMTGPASAAAALGVLSLAILLLAAGTLLVVSRRRRARI